MFQFNNYLTSEEYKEYYAEIKEYGFSKFYDLIADVILRNFIKSFKTMESIRNIEFIDFYDSLDDSAKVTIQFSSALQLLLKYSFRIRKEDRQFYIKLTKL